MNLESVADNFDVLMNTKNGVRQVKELILDIAMKGMLLDNPDKSISFTEGSQYPLPRSWRWVKIEEVADFINGFAFRSDEYCSKGVGVVRMSDMKNGEINPSGMKFVSTDRLKALDSIFQVKPNDILMGMTGATLGKPCVNKTSETFLLNQRIGKFVPKDIDPDYFLLALLNLESSFMSLSFGTGVNNLSTRQIKDSLLPLPPRDMQREIVTFVRGVYNLCDKLDTGLNSKKNLANLARKSAISAILMAHSGNELDIAWNRIQDNWSDLVQGLDGLDDLRDLALGITFSGRLTRTANLPQDEWDLTTLGNLCDVRDGTHDSPRKATTGYPLVTSKNLKKGLVDLEHSYLISENDYQEISRRSRVDKFDVLISMIGTVGQVAIVKDHPKYAIKNVGLIKTGSELLSRFIAYYLVSPQAKSHINAASSGGVQKFLSLGKLRALPISIPNSKIQEQIVLQLDQLMSVCEELEKNTIEADMLANRFTQSLLANSH